MEQKFYVASKGSWYLSVTNHPGKLTEDDIVENIERMMEKDYENEDQQPNQKQLRMEARFYYEENIERILQMVKIQVPLKKVSREELEETLNISFSEWKLWEFPRTEWD